MKNFTITLLCLSCMLFSANAQTTTDSIAAVVPMLINDSIVSEVNSEAMDSTIMEIEESAIIDSAIVVKESVKKF